MVTPSVGSVILIPLPYSNLVQAKLRPAIVLAHAGRSDWILCQVTSNAYGDERSVELASNDFAERRAQSTEFRTSDKTFYG